MLLGCAAFGALGILVGGTLRAEVTLAVANLIWLVLVLVGGIVVPVDEMPRTLAAVAQWLPTAALADGLRTALATGAAPTGQQVLVLVAWAAVAAAAAVRLGPLALTGPSPPPPPAGRGGRGRRGAAARSPSIDPWPCSTVCRPPRRVSCARWRLPPWSRRRASPSPGRSCG